MQPNVFVEYLFHFIVIDYNTFNILHILFDYIYLDFNLFFQTWICTWHKLTTMWKASWDLSHWETHDNPTSSKITFGDLKKVFLPKERNPFHLLTKELDYLHVKDFPNPNVNCTWSKHWHHHNARSLLQIAPWIIDLPLKMDGGQLSLFLEIIDYATFTLTMFLKMRQTLWWSFLCIARLEKIFNHYLWL